LTRLALVAVLFLYLLAATASAQTLYRWTDAQGRVQYSDRPPKDFKGEVVKIEPDVQPPPPPPIVKPRPATPEAVKPAEKAEGDLNSRLRANREKLAADVERARERLEAAKKARSADAGPGR
jgi:hypothetical protein